MHKVPIFTVGHGRRTPDELIAVLAGANVRTLVDVRRFPRSRRNPQFNQERLAEALGEAGIPYVHAVELGGMRGDEPDDERFSCIRDPAFRAYAARMGQPVWQQALEQALAEPAPVLMCAETPWQRCHRRFIADLLTARGRDVIHLIRPGESEQHRLSGYAEARAGTLYLCGVETA
jgi:uncharacterized protein (DUF488 family)